MAGFCFVFFLLGFRKGAGIVMCLTHVPDGSISSILCAEAATASHGETLARRGKLCCITGTVTPKVEVEPFIT